jgi:predicted lipoprotein with Yx(FWY)xxD motif
MHDADQKPMMIAPQEPRTPRWQRRKRPSAVTACGVAVALAVTASFAAVALGAGSATTVGSASSSKLGKQIVINAQGRTLYALSPETTHHLLCASSECVKFWPPLTVPSTKTKLKAGPGVQGHLGILHRHNGLLQVTLRGMPLYRYSHDHAKGQVNGDGIESFGGTWHAVSAQTSTMPTASSPPESPTTTTPTAPSYGY